MAQVVAGREALEDMEFASSRLEAEVWRVYNSLLASADSYFVGGISELIPRGYYRMPASELARVGLSAQDLRDDRSGYFAAIYRNRDTGHYLVANRGSENGEDALDWGNNHQQDWALGSAQYQQAIDVAQKMMASGAILSRNISFTGHSLGGGLAQAQSAVTGVEAVVFDAAGLRYETVSDFVSRETFDWNMDNRVHRFSSHNDSLTAALENRGLLAGVLDFVQLTQENDNARLNGTFGEFVGRDGPLAQLPEEIANLPAREGIRLMREGPGPGAHWHLPSAHMVDRGGAFAARGDGGADSHAIGLIASGLVRSVQSFTQGGQGRYDVSGRTYLWGTLHR